MPCGTIAPRNVPNVMPSVPIVLRNAPDAMPNAALNAFAYRHARLTGNGLFHFDGTFNFMLSSQGGVLPHHHKATVTTLLNGAKRWTLVDPAAYAGAGVSQRDFENKSQTGRTTTYLSREWSAPGASRAGERGKA